jgi:hypothetical protein
MSIRIVIVYVLIHTLIKRCRRTESEVSHIPKQVHLLTYGCYRQGKSFYLVLFPGNFTAENWKGVHK